MLKDNLIMLRNIHGFSQEEVAGKIGISRQAYARWESGAAVPDIVKCGRLAAVYGVTMDSLVKDEKIEGFGSVPRRRRARASGERSRSTSGDRSSFRKARGTGSAFLAARG